MNKCDTNHFHATGKNSVLDGSIYDGVHVFEVVPVNKFESGWTDAGVYPKL